MLSYVMVAIEGTCVAFLLVILTAYLVLPHSDSLKKDVFLYTLAALILGTLFDAACWWCESRPSPTWLQYSVNTLCLMSSGFLVSFFAYYIAGMIREDRPISRAYARIIAVINLCGSFIVLIAALFGKLYNIVPYPGKPGVMIYFSGSFFYDLPTFLTSLSMIVLFIIFFRNAKFIGKRKTIVFTIYFIAPMLTSCLELFNESLQLSYISACICMSIIYVMLQSNHINELRLREELLEEWSYVDPLTKLLNRRAFDRTMAEASGDEPVGIAFCDLNGLKKVNDEQGHEAGDRFLMSFAELLTGHFSHENIYRISGDEFVVIARGKDAEAFTGSIESLKQNIAAHSEIAAIGTTSGTGADIAALIREAEARMYSDKENFYRQHPDCKRRRG